MSLTSDQEFLCCLGKPVAGNPTQYMMEKAFEAAGLDWRYLTCEVPPEKLADAMRGLRALAVELALAGAGEITIVNRSSDRGQSLVDLLRQRTSVKADFVLLPAAASSLRSPTSDLRPLTSDLYSIPDTAAIFINATSIGL